MATASPERSVPFNLDLVFRPGMGWRLMLCVFVMATVPLLTIGWLNYRAARSHLDLDIHKTIRLYAELKSQQIDATIQHHLDSGKQMGREPATISLFKALLRRLETQAPPSDFVFSPAWNEAVSAYGSGIQLHADVHGYHEILMFNRDGHGIYSNAPQGDPAGRQDLSVMTPPMRDAFRAALETGKSVLSAFESGVSEDTGVRAFIMAPIGDGNDPPVGVIALKIPGSDIQKLINMPPEPGDDVRVYLIDSNLTFLAGTIDGQRPNTRLTLKTALAHRWQRADDNDRSALAPFAIMDYQDPGGHWIVGTYASIQVGSAHYALVVEMDRTMAATIITRQLKVFLAILALTVLGIVTVSVMLARMLIEPVRDLTQNMTLATHGRLDDVHDVVFASHELGRLAMVSNDLIDQNRAITAEHEIQSRLVAGMASLHRLLGGVQKPADLCFKTIEFLSDFLDLDQADFYIADNGHFVCTCHFPGQPAGDNRGDDAPEKGCMDEAAAEKTILVYRNDEAEALMTPVPATDLGNLAAVPLVLEETVIGGLIIQKTIVFSLFEGHFMQVAMEFIAIALGAALTREKEQALLERTRQQADQLKLRESDLKAKTRALEAQGRAFQESEKVLQLKHLELEAANAQMAKNAADLEANMATLEQQKRDMQKQNAELEKAHRELADKARQLEISSQYKTEFMANMSHELRTPLNSILLLSRLLLENKSSTLTTKQAEFAQTIYSAGEDLLNLINEILDLAKVESGKIEVEASAVAIQSIVNAMQASFSPLAEQSGVRFSIHLADGVPRQLISDRKRIEQIVKNFLSNAFKFTPQGSIRLTFALAPGPGAAQPSGSADESGWLSISVTDTGIGIPPSKHEMVFDAFQQVDGSTRRKYGGTGLGLSISRELARMLGGEISLDSQEGKGSCFTLHLPIVKVSTEEPQMIRNVSSAAARSPAPPSPHSEDDTASQIGHGLVPDDRHRLNPGEPCILIVDADPETGEAIMAIAHDHGYRGVVAEQRMTGLHFADYYRPTAVFINPHLTEPDEWSLINQIKFASRNHHVPVFTFSDQAEHVDAVIHGAAGHILLPIARSRLTLVFRQIKRWQSQSARMVLVIASAPQQALDHIKAAFGMDSIHFQPATTMNEARKVLEAQTVDAVILLASADAGEQRQFLRLWQARPIPLILYAEKNAGKNHPPPLEAFSQLPELDPVKSPDGLLTALLPMLHLPPDLMDATHHERFSPLERHPSPLKGRKILLVDDDMRTVFAVTSVLEDQGVHVYTGKTGKESLDKLDSFPDIDLILMDVMVAEVDGYQAIRKIRNRNDHKGIPILALTAKAMQGDRAKCLEAGADDYLSKPVNLDKLTSMLKIWLDPELTKQHQVHH